MKAASVDLKDLLVADNTLGLVFGTNLFIGREPALPNDTVTIFDAVGLPKDEVLADDGYGKLAVQIRVRNRNYEIGWDLINRITKSLHGRANFACGDTNYLGINCISDPIALDWDGNNRVRFIVNFLIDRRT